MCWHTTHEHFADGRVEATATDLHLVVADAWPQRGFQTDFCHL
eukprot:CAMPEP_0172750020 /NCGR_PEP_ID=MMETSP1074-20121228/148696_1 /TAXON_ID=2916 /ORGANISM="Ceratium fusus, Strain PA161109" /LENGTH=42 /DNA_ID= /DNA_START= /DNA_END= /DNA_ORIENTATION=